MNIFLTKYRRYFILFALGLIFAIGLFNNRIGLNRLSPGEDDMAYWGLIRKAVDFKVDYLPLGNVVNEPQNKQLLFYLLGRIWQPLAGIIGYLQFFNLAYLFFYLAAFVSFIRLASLGQNKLCNKILVAAWFVLLISNTFWLGPRYFVPAFWLFVSYPNLIVATNKKRYLESIFWIISNYFFYWFGFTLSLAVFGIVLIYTQLKNFWFQLIVAVGIGAVYYWIGLPEIASFLKQINFHSFIKEQLDVLTIFTNGYGIMLILTILIGWLQDKKIQSGLIFISLLLFSIFKGTIYFFPNDTASYRLIPLLFIAIALLLVALPNLLSFKNSFTPIVKIGQLLTIITLGAMFIILVRLNFVQNYRDFNSFAIRPEEVELFKLVDSKCQTAKCLVVTDIGTNQVGSYFSTTIASENKYLGSRLEMAVTNPLSLNQYAKDHLADQIVLLTSKRTTLLYDASIKPTANLFSRSYYLDKQDPLVRFSVLAEYLPFQIYNNPAIGLYGYLIPVR